MNLLPTYLEQNGCAERKHRHIVETTRSLLTHASIPLSFWPRAFEHVVYTINRLPLSYVHNRTPYEVLFQAKPYFHDLRIFGCLCYPWLKLYAKNKLDSHFKAYIFLGHSKVHKGNKCFDISSQKLYISRRVIFCEQVFLFAIIHGDNPRSINPNSSTTIIITTPNPNLIYFPTTP